MVVYLKDQSRTSVCEFGVRVVIRVPERRTVTLPSGFEHSQSIERDPKLATEGDPASLTEFERTVTVNGRSTESTFDADAR